MSDHFQITSIVAGAIRSCRSETTGSEASTKISTEELNCMAKAIIHALAESGLCIRATAQDDQSNNGTDDQSVA